MTRNARVLDSGPHPFLGEDVAVTDAARLDPDAHRSGTRLRDWPLNDLERSIGARNLYHSHPCHDFLRSGARAADDCDLLLIARLDLSPMAAASFAAALVIEVQQCGIHSLNTRRLL